MDKTNHTALCCVDGCGRIANRKSAKMCEMHYTRVRRNGNVEKKSCAKPGPLTHANGYLLDYLPGHPLQRGDSPRVCGERLIEVTQERDEARRQTEIVESYLEAATGKLAELIKARQVLGAELAAVKYARDELIAGKFDEEPLRRQIAELREKVGAGDTANREQSLQKLGARLAELLDEDHFAECEALLLAAGVKPYNA